MRQTILIAVFSCLALAVEGAGADAGVQDELSPPLLRFDFETGDLQGWRVVEGRFDFLVCDRRFYHNRPREPYGKQGGYFLTTLERRDGRPDDGMTGVIESPVFELQGGRITLQVGGGRRPDTYVALCTLDGDEVRHARGPDDETMIATVWETGEWIGQRMFLRVVDGRQGGWGHITCDDIRISGSIDRRQTERRFAEVDRERMRVKVQSLGLNALGEAMDSMPPGSVQQDLQGELQQYRSAFDDLLSRETFGAADRTEFERLTERFEAFRCEVLLSNPLLHDAPLLFVVRHQFRPDHHNTATIFQNGEINAASFTPGGALKVLDPATREVRTLLETETGVIRDPEVSYDGRRILFSMRCSRQDNYHIYEMESDGTGLRQLTSAPGVSDIDPFYLPDGDIVFSSTREPKYCMCNRHIMANLFRMEPDGANIRQIGKSTLFEGHGCLLPDGRILYDRWEYVDRNFGDAQGLWTMNPDGTNPAMYWGNNLNSPGGVIDARPILGTEQVLCIFGSCHDRPWGALTLLDRRRGIDVPGAVVRIWPASAMDRVGKGNWDAFLPVRPRYEDPYPLSDSVFLCSRMTGNGEAMGIYIVDLYGNEILVHAEPPSCFDPMPLAPRRPPPVIPARDDLREPTGVFYVADVYQGTHMEGVKRGEVKSLRVVESPEKRFWVPTAQWGGQGQQNPAMGWHDFNNKRILGTVPVEADGSICFEVPADTFVYFQLLDERGRMIQSMRSGTMVRPGETAGCVGCHDHRLTAPTATLAKMPEALRARPRRLNGWFGEPRTFSYMHEVQPVFDKHCIGCHDFDGPASRKLILAGDRTNTFNASYNELWRKGLIKAIGAGPSDVQAARSWGSHPSRLVQVLEAGHNDVQLTSEEWQRLVTWIDINAPYYETYASAYPHNLSGRSPLTDAQLRELGQLVGLDFFRLAGHGANQGPQVSFDRPEKSPCLKRLDAGSPAYARALEIIRAGREQLHGRPRADMDGFEPWPVDRQRQQKYLFRQAVERASRQAIREGRRVYDADTAAQDQEETLP